MTQNTPQPTRPATDSIDTQALQPVQPLQGESGIAIGATFVNILLVPTLLAGLILSARSLMRLLSAMNQERRHGEDRSDLWIEAWSFVMSTGYSALSLALLVGACFLIRHERERVAAMPILNSNNPPAR